MEYVMTEKERLAFLEAMSENGWVIFSRKKGFGVKKTQTYSNRQQMSCVKFASREASETYIAEVMGWKWEELQEEVAEVQPPELRFAAYIMCDIGFGPFSSELGAISHYCFEEVQKIAQVRAEQWFAKTYPREELEKVPHKITLMQVEK